MSDLHDHRKRDNTSDLFELKARIPEYVCSFSSFDRFWRQTFISISLLNAYNSYHLTEKLSLIVLDW